MMGEVLGPSPDSVGWEKPGLLAWYIGVHLPPAEEALLGGASEKSAMGRENLPGYV